MHYMTAFTTNQYQSSKNFKKSANALNARQFASNEYLEASRSTVYRDDYFEHLLINDGLISGTRGISIASTVAKCMGVITGIIIKHIKMGLSPILKTSFAYLAKRLNKSIRSIKTYMAKLSSLGYIQYNVVRGRDILECGKFKQNLEVVINIDKLHVSDKKIMEAFKVVLEREYDVNFDKKECEKSPKEAVDNSTLNAIESEKFAPDDFIYITEKKKLKKKDDLELERYKIEYYIELGLNGSSADSCTNNFPIETKENKKAKEFRQGAMKLLGNKIYKHYLGDCVQILEFEHKEKHKKRKFGQQLLLRFKNSSYESNFAKLYKTLHAWLPALMKDHKVVFGGYYERFIPKEDEKRNDIHDICALDEPTEAKRARHDFIHMYGQDTYASWIMLCDFKLVDGDLFLLCPNSWIQIYIIKNFEKWYLRHGLDDSSIIVIN